jgi:uncharacterized protein YbjT (DUF2867 family)
MTPRTVLVIGGTGHVGRKVIAVLCKRGVEVRAMVRPGSDASRIEGPGVTIVRGDMMDPARLDVAFAGVDAAISCAAGYTKRRKSDSAQTDRIGNLHLAQAAKRSGVGRYVLNSILHCDDAPGVSHFEDKAVAEAELRKLGVPFIAIRPGAFLDQADDFNAASVLKNAFMGIGDRDTTRWSYVYTQDLAESLVHAVFADARIVGQTIDVGWSTGPVSNKELADTIAAVTHRKLKRTTVPWWLVRAGTAIVGAFNAGAGDLGRMFLYFRTGRYVADSKRHEELLGPLPTKEDAVRRWAEEKHLIQVPVSEAS